MDVFISYSRKDYLNADDTVNDNSIIAKLLTALEQNSITYWIDKEGIYEKDNFAELITKKIIESPVFLFVSSKSSNESSWTSKEVAVAHEYEKQIIPFRIDESKFSAAVTFYLADIDQICYYKNPSIGFDLLIKSVKAKLDTYKKALDGKAKIIQIQEKIQELKDTNTVTNTEIIKYESSLAGLIRAYNSNLKQIECLEKEFKALDGNYIPSDVSKDYKVSAAEQNKILLSEIKDKDAKVKELEQVISNHKTKKVNWKQLPPEVNELPITTKQFPIIVNDSDKKNRRIYITSFSCSIAIIIGLVALCLYLSQMKNKYQSKLPIEQDYVSDLLDTSRCCQDSCRACFDTTRYDSIY